MKQLEKTKPFDYNKWVSIHDKKITEIICGEHFVQFVFKNGFDLIDKENVSTVCNGRITMKNCTANDFKCKIITTRTSKSGLKIFGHAIPMEKINDMLSNKKCEIEIYLELYDFNFMYWRGTIRSNDKKKRNKIITIETNDFFPIIYSWD